MTAADTIAPPAHAAARFAAGWAAFRENWPAWLSLAALVVVILSPIGFSEADGATLEPVPVGWIGIIGTAALIGAASSAGLATLIVGSASLAGAVYALALIPQVSGRTAIGYWAFLAACWLLGWLLAARLSRMESPHPAVRLALRIAAPAVFGAWLLVLWEIVVRVFEVPSVTLPPPSAVGERFVSALPTLWVDFRQTFLKAVVAGYAVGCLAGFLAALVCDRVDFLRRGLLPIGGLMSALPIVGVAPILVMWFGPDWQSKAAVVVVMVFFPVLVNTVAGLAAAGSMERDLMRTYAAGHWQTLVKLRLPAALPFIFNALKISSTLALIGAIVAEFFGSPIQGMGFRISAAVGRLDIAMVWAEITVAAIAGTAFYGVIALIERLTTFWHPSHRR